MAQRAFKGAKYDELWSLVSLCCSHLRQNTIINTYFIPYLYSFFRCTSRFKLWRPGVPTSRSDILGNRSSSQSSGSRSCRCKTSFQALLPLKSFNPPGEIVNVSISTLFCLALKVFLSFAPQTEDNILHGRLFV